MVVRSLVYEVLYCVYSRCKDLKDNRTHYNQWFYVHWTWCSIIRCNMTNLWHYKLMPRFVSDLLQVPDIGDKLICNGYGITKCPLAAQFIICIISIAYLFYILICWVSKDALHWSKMMFTRLQKEFNFKDLSNGSWKFRVAFTSIFIFSNILQLKMGIIYCDNIS